VRIVPQRFPLWAAIPRQAHPGPRGC
jgi:hypothetical protein